MLERKPSFWQNSNLQIQAWIAGKAHTPWEKYRLLCNQLGNRQQALGAAEAAEKRRQAKVIKANEKLNSEIESERLEAEADLLEAESSRHLSESCVASARSEVAWIQSLIDELEPILEQTRLPGYSDTDMFQEVQEEEWAQEFLRRAENNYISRIFGNLPSDQIDAMRSHPLWESRILPNLQKMHREMMPQVLIANNPMSGIISNPNMTQGESTLLEAQTSGE
jgi:hypothetical protein